MPTRRRATRPTPETMKRPKGKPTRFPGKTDGVRLGVRITQEGHKALARIAASEACTISDAIEFCIRKVAKLPTDVVWWESKP